MKGGRAVGEFQFAVPAWQGFLLIAAAAAKVRAPRRSATPVAGYRLVPSALILARSVAGVVVILGTGLIGGWQPAVMLPLAAALFGSFGLATASALLRGRRPFCGCGVGEDSPVIVARTGGLAISAGLSGAVPPSLQVLRRALAVGLRMHNGLEALPR
ncbi:hypothetical protein GCM10009687_18780 [Asanoa iriomotensis]|uniref:Methylamine utilisation protein MauE domain-containing protein n=2 Tax=Asanoa iriomotensis TaxID=234613 RepID=A0ABQ4C5S5_9ACTN|nr:hypothetical protein Air01nite_42260 [Asanoa iriomotensis]